MKSIYKTIMSGVTMRKNKNGTSSIRFSCMIRGKRHSDTCKLPFDYLIDPTTGKMTRRLLVEFASWKEECAKRDGIMSSRGIVVPTIDQLVKCYEEIAWKRNADPDYQTPSERTIVSAIRNYGYCLDASGLSGNRPYTDLCNPDMARKLFKHFRDEMGLSGVSAKSYVVAMNSVTARWTIVEYRDRGFDVSCVLVPDFGNTAKAKRYERLDSEQVDKINAWYLDLMDSAPANVQLAAVLIYNLAIRPIDCGLLTAENFPEENGHRRLHYLPVKTKNTSGVWVDMEIPDALFEQIRTLSGSRFDSGETLINSYRETFKKLNASMRPACGLEDSNKAAYELRKLCLDTVMRCQGIEQAVKLSGDRRETIEKSYTDPRKGTEALCLVAPVSPRSESHGQAIPSPSNEAPDL